MYTIHTLVKEPKKDILRKISACSVYKRWNNMLSFSSFRTVVYILYTELFRPSSLNPSVLALLFTYFSVISPSPKMKDLLQKSHEKNGCNRRGIIL